jgi:hypothetical protein
LPSARIAFAGLSPLCEEILRAALLRRPDIELVAPWTRLCALASDDSEVARELLVVELDQPVLPPALRAMLAAAQRLRVIALTPDARSATIFGLVESRTVLFDCSAERLWTALDPDL